MYWSRVKTILIILFLCINIFLLVSMMVTINDTITISQDTVENTIQVLKQNNIKVDRSIIPTKMHDLPILVMENLLSNPDIFAEKILGKDFTKSTGEEIYIYTAGDKYLTINGCVFEYVDKSPKEPIANLNVDNAQKYANETLEKFNLASKYMVLDSVEKIGEGWYRLIFFQRFEDYDILGCDVIMDISDQGLRKVSGTLLIPKEFTGQKYPIRHITSILIEFMKDPQRPKDTPVTIVDISLEYWMDTSRINVKQAPAIPMWKISTDKGDFKYRATNIED